MQNAMNKWTERLKKSQRWSMKVLVAANLASSLVILPVAFPQASAAPNQPCVPDETYEAVYGGFQTSVPGLGGPGAVFKYLLFENPGTCDLEIPGGGNLEGVPVEALGVKFMLIGGGGAAGALDAATKDSNGDVLIAEAPGGGGGAGGLNVFLDGYPTSNFDYRDPFVNWESTHRNYTITVGSGGDRATGGDGGASQVSAGGSVLATAGGGGAGGDGNSDPSPAVGVDGEPGTDGAGGGGGGSGTGNWTAGSGAMGCAHGGGDGGSGQPGGSVGNRLDDPNNYFNNGNQYPHIPNNNATANQNAIMDCMVQGYTYSFSGSGGGDITNCEIGPVNYSGDSCLGGSIAIFGQYGAEFGPENDANRNGNPTTIRSSVLGATPYPAPRGGKGVVPFGLTEDRPETYGSGGNPYTSNVPSGLDVLENSKGVSGAVLVRYIEPLTMLSVSPGYVPLTGGTITITGTGFNPGVVDGQFGPRVISSVDNGGNNIGIDCTNITVVSTTELTCDYPDISSMSSPPNSVTLSITDDVNVGYEMIGASRVLRNRTAYSVADMLYLGTPPAAPGVPGIPTVVGGNGSATVTVVAPSTGGTPASYTVTASPTPSSGSATCTVTGASGSCSFSNLTNGTAYTFTSTATNAGGTSGSSQASSAVTPNAAAPTVSSISPTSGSSTGGTSVMITGSNFVTGATVTIGGVACSNPVVSATSITCTTGSGSAGSSNIVVTNPDSQSATLTGGFTVVAAPVPNSNGVLPELTPGASQAWRNGVDIPVVVEATATGWQMTGSGFIFGLEIPKSNGESGSTDGVVTLTRAREVEVSGQGFLPGTFVDVWLFSSPTYLGSVLVAADGTFKASLEVSNSIPVGEHTLQANGTSSDGSSRTLNLGVRVVDMTVDLPATGRRSTFPFVAVWFLFAGLVAFATRRRLLNS